METPSASVSKGHSPKATREASSLNQPPKVSRESTSVTIRTNSGLSIQTKSKAIHATQEPVTQIPQATLNQVFAHYAVL